jgi:predicted nucleic acid-binding protein
MENSLIDAGPLIALFNRRDSYHQSIVNFLKEYHAVFWTTWPVLTEASHMLDFSLKAQMNLLEWVNRGGVQIVPLTEKHLNKIISYSAKFADVPMNLADASLMVASEIIQTNKIVSIDSDFYIYRDFRNQYLTNVFLNS